MKKIFAALLTGMVLLNTMAFSSAEAGKLVSYRDMLAQKKFTLRYENITPLPRVTNKDKLVYIEKAILEDSKEYILSRVKIKQFSNDVPGELFAMPKGCKVYAVGIGDMDDLLNKPALVEEY